MIKKRSKKKTGSPSWLKWVIIGALGLIVVAAVSGLFLSQLGDTVKEFPAEINVEEAYKLYNEGTFLLDVRSQEEWNEYHIPDTTLIPLDQLPSRLDEVPINQTVVIICRSGNRSQLGRDILNQAGYEQVVCMAGGLNAWRAQDYPIVTGP
jgi:rhodanese-related sulfurtransferase